MTKLELWTPLHDENAVDLSGNGNDGTINGATTGVAGRGGLQAMSFDGTDDYIQISDSSSLDYGTTVTVSAWILRTDNSNWDLIYEQRNSNFNGAWLAGTYQADTATFHLDDSGGTNHRLESSAGSVPLNEWVHVVGTYDGSTQKIYINGSLDSSTSSSFTPLDPNVTRYLGAGQSNTEYYFNGVIADVRLYNRALSSSEIQTLYDWGSGDYATPPDNDDGGISYYKLDEDSGTTATDSWGSNDGTVNGATVGVSGVRDTSYSFDGTDDYVDFGTFPWSGLSTFTVSGWVKKESGGGNNPMIFNAGDDSTSTYFTLIFYDGVSDGSITGELRGSSNGTLDGPPPQLGEWYHYVMTYDGSTGRLYVNGDEVDSVSASVSFSNDKTTQMGQRVSNGGDHFAGDIDEFRIYDFALESHEVHDLYQYGTFGRDMRELTVTA